jgi:hypothetical protein
LRGPADPVVPCPGANNWACEQGDSNDRSELLAQEIGEPGNPIRPLFSIAISLRRIADALDKRGNGKDERE